MSPWLVAWLALASPQELTGIYTNIGAFTRDYLARG